MSFEEKMNKSLIAKQKKEAKPKQIRKRGRSPLSEGEQNMKSIYLLALVLLAGSAFAQSCYSSGDCGDNEYCGSGTCKPYFSSTTTTSGCCAPAAILGLVCAGAVLIRPKPC